MTSAAVGSSRMQSGAVERSRVRPNLTVSLPKKALLLAAGLGVRLRPLTLARPKPMMTLWDVPLLEHALRLLESWGVEEVAVNTHWRPEAIGAWAAARKGRAKIVLSHEPDILGTGGALRPLQGFLGDGPFWMMNADVAASLDPGPLAEAFAENGFAAAWVMHDKGPRSVEVDRKGRVTCWRSPTPGVPWTATFCGLQLLSPRIFEFLPEKPFSTIVEAYERAMAQGVFVRGVSIKESFWDDAGTAEAYLRIHRVVKQRAQKGQRGGELYLPGADRLPAGSPTFFCVGRDAKVADDADGKSSVVCGGAEVLKGNYLKGCVVAGGVLDCAVFLNSSEPRHVNGRRTWGEGIICTSASETADEGLVRAVEAMGWTASRTAAVFLGARGSDRSFWRVSDGGRSAIVIRYSPARAENGRYAGHARTLAAAGVPVPAVLADLPEARCLALEDCGSDSLQRHMMRHRLRLKPENCYPKVVEALVRLHREGTAAVQGRAAPAQPIPTVQHGISTVQAGPTPQERDLEPPFDAALYAWEHGLFEEHLLKARHGFECLPAEAGAELNAVAGKLLGARQVLVHRDCQSSNVLFHKKQPVFIDFQGMRYGAGAYDLASLLYDPYVILDGTLRDRLARHYRVCFPENADAVALLREGAVQRLVQALGAFGRLAAAGQAGFAQYIPQALENLLEVADALDLDALGGLAEELIARENFRKGV